MLISFSNIIQAEQNATIWCTQYRQLSNRTLDKEFDISHLILHLNEDLNAFSIGNNETTQQKLEYIDSQELFIELHQLS
uniref:Solute carrier family, putative n=1 Tax=Schistosoma mansoni TaxID=6183 RepID=A0A5K4EVX7_SCHMA